LPHLETIMNIDWIWQVYDGHRISLFSENCMNNIAKKVHP
jgi:hypothetical protein